MDSDLGCIKLGPDCRLSRLYHLIKEPAATVRPQWLFRQLVRPARSGAVCFATHCTATSSGLSFSFGKWAVYRQTECLCPCSPMQWSFYIAPFLHLTFLLPLFLPASLPNPGSPLQVQIFAWSETPSCCSSAPSLAPWSPTKRGRDGSSLCLRAASCSWVQQHSLWVRVL